MHSKLIVHGDQEGLSLTRDENLGGPDDERDSLFESVVHSSKTNIATWALFVVVFILLFVLFGLFSNATTTKEYNSVSVIFH